MAMPRAAKSSAINHESKSERDGGQMRWPKTREQTDHHDQQALDACHRCSPQGATDHDLEARDGGNQRLFEKAKLTIPKKAKARKD